MTRSFPNLGFDPTPGDVEETRSLAKQLNGVADELNRTVIELVDIDLSGWTGQAAKAFAVHITQDVQPLLIKAQQSFGGAGKALSGWAHQLQGFQHEADTLEALAATKQHDLSAATTAAKAPSPSSSSSTPHPTPSGDEDPTAKKKQQAVSDAGDALNAVIKRAHDLHDRYMTAAGATGRSLDKAGHIAPAKPGFFSSLAHDVEGAWDSTTQWVKDHADAIKFISDVMSDISGFLGVLAIITAPIEPFGAIFAGLSLATGAVALVGDLVAKAAGANVSWASIGISALGVVPGLGAFSKGAKFATEGAAIARATELGKGFEPALATGKSLFKVGEEGKVAEGAVNFVVKGRQVALFGPKTGGVVKATGILKRAQSISDASYRPGQLFGTKALRTVTGGKVNIPALSVAGRKIDSTVKVASKIPGIPGQVKDFHSMMDEFHHTCTAH